MYHPLCTMYHPLCTMYHPLYTLFHPFTCTLYHPASDDWTLLNHIDQSLDYIRRHHPYTGAILMSEFNKMKDSHLKQNHNLKQIVDRPTRGSAILDNIYIIIPGCYVRPVISAPIGLSDHKVVECTPSTSTKYTEPVVTKTSSRNHKPLDRAFFAVALSLTSRETLFHLPTCEQKLNVFNSSISIYSTYQPANNN